MERNNERSRQMNKPIPLALVSISLGAVAQFLLKVGVNSMGGFRLDKYHLLGSVIGVLLEPHIAVGILIFVSSMLMWLMVISSMELSRAYPMISISYIIITLLSRFILHESLPPMRLAGIVVILTGVVMISL